MVEHPQLKKHPERFLRKTKKPQEKELLSKMKIQEP